MLRSFFEKITRMDWILLAVTVILFCFGLTAIYSVGLGKEPQNFFYFYKQLYTFLAALVIMFIASLINYRLFKSYIPFAFGLVMIVLIVVLFLGETVRGTKGWFEFGILNFQPAELAKIFLVLVLALFFSRISRKINQFKYVFYSFLIAALPIGLVLIQPDFGSAVILFLIWFSMLFTLKVNKKYLVIILVGILIMLAISWQFIFKEYQKNRIMTFINPASDTLGRSYNVKQAIIAVGSGSILGHGIGYGSQSHLKFLPENQTDFIFSVIAEEMGFLGITIIVVFWVVFFQRLSRIALKSQNEFALFTVLGFSFLFLSQIIINIGGNLGLMPVTGIVLPFFSYGGSALLANMFIMGIIQNIYIHK